jgi:hypothetical protein
MGLDMYAYRTKVEISGPTDFQDEVYSKSSEECNENECTTDNENLSEELMYWRKHPNLHGWMENLYYEKGGKSESFNCVTVELTLEDLDSLEKAVMGQNLPTTEGFFFGTSDEEINEKDIAFINLARKAIEEGDKVFYDSWW